MKKKIVAIALTMTVSLAAMQTLWYEPVLADRIEEVTGEDADEPDPETQTAEEVIDEDYDVTGVAINETTFPDAIFRSYISDKFDTDSDGYLNNYEISSVTEIRVWHKSISDLTGIEYFPELKILECPYNQLTSLDISNNRNLDDLECNFNTINDLDLSNNPLLTCVLADHNNITVFDISLCPFLVEAYDEYGLHSGLLGAIYCSQSYSPGFEGYPYFSFDPGVRFVTETYTEDALNMYRLYNPNSGEHFYTSNTGERNNLISVGWNYEGIGWVAPETSNTPVYRLYNQYGGEHHYTTSIAERDHLVSLGWNDEGIGWYSDDAHTVPLYRQYNPNAYANNHNYTTSLSENNWLVSIGWQAEGIGWYGVGT